MRTKVLCCLLAALALVSCTRDPIYGEVSGYRITFDIDNDVLYCRPALPELFQVMFYDCESGKKVYETYMGSEGGYLHAFNPGRYHVVVYGLGGNKASVEYTKDFKLLSIETKVFQNTPMKIRNAPEHLLMGALTEIEIPYRSEADPEFILTVPVASVCDSWKVCIHGIKGLQYSSSARLVVNRQVCGIEVDGMKKDDIGSIISMSYDIVGNEVLEMPFCTFGMPDEGAVTIRVELEAQDRRVHTAEYDITSQVRDQQNISHIINVQMDIELQPMVQGGLDPSADEWDPHHEHIEIK